MSRGTWKNHREPLNDAAAEALEKSWELLSAPPPVDWSAVRKCSIDLLCAYMSTYTSAGLARAKRTIQNLERQDGTKT